MSTRARQIVDLPAVLTIVGGVSVAGSLVLDWVGVEFPKGADAVGFNGTDLSPLGILAMVVGLALLLLGVARLRGMGGAGRPTLALITVIVAALAFVASLFLLVKPETPLTKFGVDAVREEFELPPSIDVADTITQSRSVSIVRQPGAFVLVLGSGASLAGGVLSVMEERAQVQTRVRKKEPPPRT